jgi:hypothetical protein
MSSNLNDREAALVVVAVGGWVLLTCVVALLLWLVP